MREIKKFVERYEELVFPGGRDDFNRYDIRDTALADLCLHFLHSYLPQEPASVVPTLLQGHLAHLLEGSSARSFFSLRQYAGNLCSRLAWRKALSVHARAGTRTAYDLSDGLPTRRAYSQASIIALLDRSLVDAVPYTIREFHPATPGHAKIKRRAQSDDDPLIVSVPAFSTPPHSILPLPRRTINPPISFRWDTLLETARVVDARETSPGFPAWMQKLSLWKRLSKVTIEGIGDDFFRNGVLTLDGTKHVVGMLSSGKSTLLHALLFTLVSAGYNKRVLVLSPDTASASQLVARLDAHGVLATVISSHWNRDEHLSAAHWNARGYPSGQTLAATAALTRSLGTACPLEGSQSLTQSAGSRTTCAPFKLSDKPCDRLIQGNQKGAEKNTDCPLITVCPVHEQQRSLGNAKVFVMTAPALLNMTPNKAFIGESLSFPELFQYLADVVLIDEADSVQEDFDTACTQEKDLLSPHDGAFVTSSIQAVAKSIGSQTGQQYANLVNVKWHRELNRLQDSVSAIYHLILKHTEELRWITERRTFTAASILADLVPRSGADSDAQNFVSNRMRLLEQIGILAGMLYGDTASDEDDHDANRQRLPSLDGTALAMYGFLAETQKDITELILDEEPAGVIAKISNHIRSGVLIPLASADKPAKNKAGSKWQPKRPPVPDDANTRAIGIALALLTNICLSSYAYLVRNYSAVQDDFGLATDDAFRETTRILRHYGNIVPRPLFGMVFGLMFSPSGERHQGGTLKLVNHLGVGRFLLTHFDRLLKHEGQAGPHVLLVSGTSWAGGTSPIASPSYDVQWPVSAILRQPPSEVEALSHSHYEFVSLGANPIAVSGTSRDDRRANLRQIAHLLGRQNPSGTRLEMTWRELSMRWNPNMSKLPSRRRALLVANNYEDAKTVANEFAKSCGQVHSVYCLVSDRLARTNETERDGARSAEGFHRKVMLLPRSRVEDFGRSDDGAVLVAPLGPISRGHNIVTELGDAAISTIYFLHRPHPRPDDNSVVIGMFNRLAMDVLMGRRFPETEGISFASYAKWFVSQAHQALNDGFALRVAYGLMSDKSRAQYAWDLMTSLWQTIGRGIRNGVPIYVGFVDSKFAPGRYSSPPKPDTEHSSALLQCRATLREAISTPDTAQREIALRLYEPFLSALDRLFEDNREEMTT